MIQSPAVDVVACAAAHGAVIAALHAGCFDKPWNTEAITRLIRPPIGFGFLACRRSTPPLPLGLVLCRVAGGESEILSLGVSPPHRRGGVGALLLDAAAGGASERGASRLFLEVAETNGAAIALYSEKGFRRVGLRPDYFDFPGARCDALVLGLDLKAANGRAGLESRNVES